MYTYLHTHTRTHTQTCVCICMCVNTHRCFKRFIYLPTPPPELGATQGHFFSVEFNRFRFRVFLVLVFLLTIPRLKSLVWPIVLPIAGKKIVVFISFARVLALRETQTDPSWIWTRVAGSISFDGSHYTTSASKEKWHKEMYLVTQPLRHWLDVTRVQSLNGVQLVWIQTFSSRWLVA